VADKPRQPEVVALESSRAGDEGPDPSPLERAQIIVNDQLRVVAGQSMSALCRVNDRLPRARDHRALFHRDHTIHRVRVSRSGTISLERVSPVLLQLYLSRCADFYRLRGNEQVPTHPEIAIAQALLAAADELPLPDLRGIISAPAYRPDFTLISSEGYDRSTGLYYLPPPELKTLSVPSSPTTAAIESATRAIIAPVFEFGFKDPASAANYRGATMTPLVMHAVRHAPMYCIRAAQQAAGKTLLSQSIPVIHLGAEVPSIAVPQPHSDEWEKRLVSIAMKGVPIVVSSWYISPWGV
jgi:hypothetical protein